MSKTPYPRQWEQILNVLPKHKWAIMPAAIEVGYSESYAGTTLPGIMSKNRAFQEAIKLKKKELQVQSEWDLQELQQKYMELHKECTEVGDRSNAKGCLDSLTRIQGGFRDKSEVDVNTPEQSMQGFIAWLQERDSNDERNTQ